MSETFPELIMNAALSAGCTRVLACIDTPLIALDFQMVWAGALPATDDRQTILNAVDSMLNNVLSLRRTWVAARSSDLYLMMMAPLGSVDQPAWKALTAEIERDDRLARKHVWLPDKEGGNFLPFIDTTFLARPWSTSDGRVDALKLLTEQIAMPTGWQQVLLHEELQGTELVQKLIDLEIALAS